MIRTYDRKLIQVDVPAELLLLRPPDGWTIDRWYQQENDRLARMYPEVKIEDAEVPAEFAEMITAVSAFEAWAKRKKLLKLALREEMGYARVAMVNGNPVAERRQYHVREHPVRAYDVDTIVAR